MDQDDQRKPRALELASFSMAPIPGVAVALRASPHAPIRYASVHNFSAAGAVVTVYAGDHPTQGGALFTVPANRLVGVPIPECAAVCFTVDTTQPQPDAADQAIVAVSSAHLPATGASL